VCHRRRNNWLMRSGCLDSVFASAVGLGHDVIRDAWVGEKQRINLLPSKAGDLSVRRSQSIDNQACSKGIKRTYNLRLIDANNGEPSSLVATHLRGGRDYGSITKCGKFCPKPKCGGGLSAGAHHCGVAAAASRNTHPIGELAHERLR
jgi:hypothetical protein